MTAQPRETLAVYGPARGKVRVLIERGEQLVRVQWYEHGRLRKQSWPNTKEGRAEAKAWALGFSEARTLGPFQEPERLSLRELWTRFVAAEWAHLRPKTQLLYTDYWRKWELFLGNDFVAEDARLEHVDAFRAELSKRRGIAVGHVQRIIRLVKTVYTWGEHRELLSRNRLAGYRFKRAKDEREVPPPEYSLAEREAIVAALSPQRSDQWRPWAAIMIASHQGARMGAILHLRREDFDLRNARIRWAARYDKQGKERWQPLTWGAYSALLAAEWWRQRDAYRGPWLFYSSHGRKRDRGDDARAVYHPTSLERALCLAEARAGVQHKPYRGMHGFRRAVSGDIARATRDVKLALEFIGDTDLRRAKEYIQERDELLLQAADVMDRLPNRPVTVPEGGELVGVSVSDGGNESWKLPRQDSNLRPVEYGDPLQTGECLPAKRLASTKGRPKTRSAPKTPSSHRPQTVPQRRHHRKGRK